MLVTAPVERSEVRGHRQQIGKSAALTPYSNQWDNVRPESRKFYRAGRQLRTVSRESSPIEPRKQGDFQEKQGGD
jgi:hypothetical protein